LIDKLPPELQATDLGFLGLLPPPCWPVPLAPPPGPPGPSAVLVDRPPLGDPDGGVECAKVGGGLASWWGVDAMASNAVVGVTAWLGPRGIEVLIADLARRYFGRNASGE